MVKKRQSPKDKLFDELLKYLIRMGLFHIVYTWLFQDEKLNSIGGIAGIPNRVRWFRSFVDNKKEPYKDELIKLDNLHKRMAFRLAIQASQAPELNGNWIKFFKDDIITGELIKGQLRILFYQLDPLNFVLLTVFLKKDDETDKFHKQKARNHISRIQNNS